MRPGALCVTRSFLVHCVQATKQSSPLCLHPASPVSPRSYCQQPRGDPDGSALGSTVPSAATCAPCSDTWSANTPSCQASSGRSRQQTPSFLAAALCPRSTVTGVPGGLRCGLSLCPAFPSFLSEPGPSHHLLSDPLVTPQCRVRPASDLSLLSTTDDGQQGAGQDGSPPRLRQLQLSLHNSLKVS